jgi:transcriptional regulator with XRE-family HTH domain
VRVTSQQVKAARALLSWTSVQLAGAAGLGRATIWRLESVDGPLGGEAETVAKIVGALEAAGVEFMDGDKPGVRVVQDPGAGAVAKAPARKKAATKATAKRGRTK